MAPALQLLWPQGNEEAQLTMQKTPLESQAQSSSFRGRLHEAGAAPENLKALLGDYGEEGEVGSRSSECQRPSPPLCERLPYGSHKYYLQLAGTGNKKRGCLFYAPADQGWSFEMARDPTQRNELLMFYLTSFVALCIGLSSYGAVLLQVPFEVALDAISLVTQLSTVLIELCLALVLSFAVPDWCRQWCAGCQQ
eukprot:2087705-Amphidinium_carterae.1